MDRPLQLITYLVPSHPVELYECVAHYLEDELGVHATLSYESRDPVQLFGRHPNPFVYGHADIGKFVMAAVGGGVTVTLHSTRLS